MVDDNPSAEALAVKDGRIVAVGDLKTVSRYRRGCTRVVDLKGHALLPGFIDAHGHASMVGMQAMSANILPAPDGPGGSVASVLQALREHIRTSPYPDRLNGLVLGFGYDDSLLDEKRHPTRDDLDAVSSEVPIVLIHQSSHFGAFNSKALAMAGITVETPDPPGGVIRRRPGSNEPDGVLEEVAFFDSLGKMFPANDAQLAVDMLLAGQAMYLRYGYTTIQDGRTSAAQTQVGMLAAERGLLKADIVAYPDVLDAGNLSLMAPPWFHDVRVTPSYRNRFRIGGVKLTLDGSPQGKTAWLTQPYAEPPAGRAPDYAGYGVVDDAVVRAVFTRALRNHWQFLVHANGDRAIDQMLAQFALAKEDVPGVDVKPVLIHGQTLREDQVDRLQTLGVFPSLFPMHTFYWGDWHRTSVLGPERAENISPTGWLGRRGMPFTTHHDAPVAFPDAMRVVASAVNRSTRSGYVLGAHHRIDRWTALKTITSWAADQHFEGASKGSLAPGKLADLVILSDNPLTIDASKITDIRVLETVKEGRTIHEARALIPARRLTASGAGDVP